MTYYKLNCFNYYISTLNLKEIMEILFSVCIFNLVSENLVILQTP